MKISLSAREREEIETIVQNCNEADGTGYQAPLDADGYYLSKKAGKTVSFLAFYELGEEKGGKSIVELLLFTDPEERGQGRMQKITARFFRDIAGMDLVFKFQVYISEISRSYFDHIGAEHVYDELLLTKELSKAGIPPEVLSYDGEAEDRRFENEHSEVSVKIYGRECYLYDVRTDASHLREGSAERLLRETLTELALSSARAVLQVSSENTPALRLYEKLGFTVAECLEMWYHKPIL